MPLNYPALGGATVGDIAAGVWAYLPDRRLTNLSDIRAARIDNLDALLSSRLSKSDFDTKIPDARAARIDKIVTLEEESVGTLTADGSEQTVVERSALGTLEGHIDLASMQAADTVVIKEYIMLKSGGTYRLYDSATYSGVQAKPNLHVVKLPARYGVRVTLQQTAGVNRNYDYNFFREVLA